VPKPDITKEIRENLMAVKSNDRHNREAYRDNTRFLNGEQWEPLEAQARRGKRLMLTADQLNAPVDQVVNSVRQNKPGPKVSPSGSGTDKYDADIMEGILRRIDSDNVAWVAFETAMETATGGNFGCWEVGLDYENERSFERKVTVEAIPNPNETVFFDPTAIKKDRSDAEWALRLYSYSLEKYKAQFGSNTKIPIRSGMMSAIFDFYQSFRDPSMSGWAQTDGIQVAKYWKVEREQEMLLLYSNGVAYWDSERDLIPRGVVPDARKIERKVEHRSIHWYITNGYEILDDGVWVGQYIPLFPVYGRERWVDNKRYISSMIQLAKQAQQAFNFSFTGACEVLASTSKSPFIGLLGQFRSKYNQWKTSNTTIAAFLEYDEVELKNGTVFTEAPKRNIQEPPIQAFLAFCNLCINAIQRSTSIFDPSLGKQKSDQSGRAIQELQEQSTEGNYHWSDALTIALTHYYRVVADIVQQEYDAPQATKILRADGSPEEVEINKTFEHSTPDGKKTSRIYNIAQGNFAYTVDVGPSAPSQRQAAAMKIAGLIKVLPPQLVAAAADLIAKLNDLGPLGDEIANRWIPPQYRDANDPQAATAKLAQAMQQNQQLTQVVQKLSEVLKTKKLEGMNKKEVAFIQALATIRSAEIKAGSDEGQRDADSFEHILGLAHDAASSAVDRQHELNLNDQEHGQTMEQMLQDHANTLQQNQQQADLAPEPEPATQT
jgi:hypothetical protein